jgi:hypothetical protein
LSDKSSNSASTAGLAMRSALFCTLGSIERPEQSGTFTSLGR